LNTSGPRDRARAQNQWIDSLVARRRVVALVGGGGLIAGVALLGIFLNLGIASPGTPPGRNAVPAAPGSLSAFTYLAAQHSNFCQLQQSTVMSYSDGMRLQGACCNALDRTKYQLQVRGLLAYSNNADIAPDPYDVSVGLAKRLFAYDGAITLNAPQQAVYATAIGMTADKGPCCCKCWRWYMTRGLAKSLIADRGMSADMVAKIVDLSNGCGGPPDSSVATSGPLG
jgi:hypothetical protein